MSDLQPPHSPDGAAPATAAQPRFWGLVPCAGMGTRALAPGAQAGLPKQYQVLVGWPLVLHTLAAFSGVVRLEKTLVAVAPDDDFFDRYPRAHLHWFVARCGGATRALTVLGGLQVLRESGARDTDWVLVHDAARCLVTTADIDALIDACQHDGVGGLLAHKLADTLKTASDGPGGVRVAATVDRSDKWLAQTPQMFRLGVLRQALAQRGAGATDEASAMEAVGLRPRLVACGAHNFKVTYPQDFALAEAVLLQRMQRTTLGRFGGERGEAAKATPRTVYFSRPAPQPPQR